MANSIVQTIRDAEVDARSLSDFISKDPSFAVTRRLAPTIHTLDYYLLVLNEVKEKGDVADIAISDTLYKLEQLEPTVIQRVDDAINNTAVEGGVLADTFVVVDGNQSQRDVNQKTTRTYNDLASMLADDKLKAGQFATTLGYANKGDNGGCDYYIDVASSNPANRFSVLLDNPALRAVAISKDNTLNIAQVGVLPTNTGAANKTKLDFALSKLTNFKFNVTDICPLDSISLPPNMKLGLYGTGGFTVDKQTTTLISSPESTDLYISQLSFFGSDLLERVFNTSGNIFFTENTVTRLYSKTVSASAGVVNYANSNNKTAIIENNIVKDIGGIITGLTGYSAGATRAFTIQSPTLPTNKTYVLVQGNTFDNIFGREGDIIQCYDALSDSDAALSVSLVKINNNIFGGSNRRAIKIQGNNVEVTNNTFTTIDKTHPEWNRDGQGGAGIISVGTFTGQYNNKGVIIDGNTFNNNGGIKQSIYLQSHKDVSVTNNIHRGVSSFISLFGNTCKNITIKKNELHGSTAINLGTGAGVSYCDNIHYFSSAVKGLWENITEFPSDFSFQRNEVYIDKVNTLAFLALFVIDASVVTPMDCKGAIIKDNIVADAGNLTYGGLFRLPSKTFELKNLNVLSNHTHGTYPIYSSGNPIETKDSNIINNTTSAGLYVKPTITP